MDSRAAEVVAAGSLYVVATPIGNLGDITLRALDVLKAVDLVAAEDTRKTARLLSHFRLKAPLISYHEHNEPARTPELLRRLQQGASIALVTNAGTPGFRTPATVWSLPQRMPGSASFRYPASPRRRRTLSASGLATDAFVFAGFLPKKGGPRLRQIKALAADTRTVILYESPQRIVALVEELIAGFGDLLKRYSLWVKFQRPWTNTPASAKRLRRSLCRLHPR